MYCKHCGSPVDSDATFCSHCGGDLSSTAYAPVQSAPVPSTYDAAGPSPTKVMVFGIVGLALSGLGIPGVILSAIALHMANQFVRLNGAVFGQAKVGRILAKVGLILGIVMTVIWALYIILFVVWIVGRVSTAPSYHYYSYY